MKKLKALFFGLLSIIVAVFCFTEEIINAFPQAEPLAEVKEEDNNTLRKFSPKVKKGTPNQILEYKGYTVSYNNKTLLPNWVAYELTRKEAQGEHPRNDNFRQDPRVKGKQADVSDYRRSGWDRGHMAPAGDMKWSAKAMDESYYFTNICPQNRQLNGGDWKELEEQCRKWAIKYGKVNIVCGPIVQENKHGKLGKNGVVIPDSFYKIVSYSTPKGNVVKGYVFYNPPKRKSAIDTRPAKPRPLESYVKEIAEIEKVTGIKFQ